MEQEDFCLGIQEINEQHQTLVDMLNDLSAAFDKSRPAADIKLSVARLVDTVRNHFHFEEALMRMYGFPRLATHQRDHAVLLAEFSRIETHALDKGAENELMQALQDYFMRHMQQYDRDYAEFILHGATIVAPGTTETA